MEQPPAEFGFSDSIVTISLNDPERRNALGIEMFDALDACIARVASRDDVHAVLLRGAGSVFCAGFDLAAAVDEPSLIASYILRLSKVNRSLRRLPPVVVASVQGAAIAGGCALLSACDFVIAEPEATFGYPVHRLGVSPAVTLPTLMQAIGAGPARALVMSGDLINGSAAQRIGLVTHLADDSATLQEETNKLCSMLAAKPPGALRVTKAWLNELDGSLDDDAFERTARDSADLAGGDEAARMLAEFWESRGAR